MTQIYATTDWYRERPEREQEWHGVLRERETLLGPATRTAAAYTLVTADEEIPIYAADVRQKLAPFVGRQVSITGKLIDLRQEGFGQEIWIASIQARQAGSK